MLQVFPDYYKDFKCIKGACRHNCCIGWEIDIDPDTLSFYDTVCGEMGNRLHNSICRDGDAHFILGKDGRCPHLNKENLCDIIIGLGEEHLCNICADHPRFKNQLPNRVEVGLGLCCEAAAKLILGRRLPAKLEYTRDGGTEDEIIILRDKIISALQNRNIPIWSRLEIMFELCGVYLPEIDFIYWADILLSLERLDDEWTVRLKKLKQNLKTVDLSGFARHIRSREYEYEQFAVYLVYRHLANAPDLDDAALRAAFAALSVRILYMLGASLWAETGHFTFEDQIEIARLFSSEIEYSNENLYIIFDKLWEEINYGKVER